MSAKTSPKIANGIFWYWNATPTLSGIRSQLKSIASAGFSCVYIHPMPDDFHKNNFFCGMKCRYLGKKYFSLVKYALEESKKLGLTFMLYDEGGWPSGSVVDTLTKKYPECRAKTAQMLDNGEVVEKYIDCPDQFRAEPVRRFIEMTHELYKKELGDEFGKSIRGIFTDEPFLRINTAYGVLTVNDEIISELKKQYGKDFYRDILPFTGIGKAGTPESENARRLYYDVCTKLFKKHFSEQLANWCKENKLDLEGHFSGEDDYLRCGVTGNLLRVLTPFHVPGIDTIWRQIYPNQPYSFFPRFASSVAMRMKRKQTLCEAFNVYTYAISPRVMNFVANALLVQGINRILPMPYMYKDTGKFKICCSTDISPRTPTYDAMNTLNDFWKHAADFDAGKIDADVWLFTQYPLPGMEYENPPRMEAQSVYNDKITSLCDTLDHNAVFWRFADEDDRNIKHLPRLLIVPVPDALMETQKKAIEYWKSKGVTVINDLTETDLKKYAEFDVAEDNVCRIFPCIRPEGRAVMVFNSSEKDTVFSFKSAKEYSLLDNGAIDTVYPLELNNGLYQLSMPAHSLRILLESDFTASTKSFDFEQANLEWQVVSVENLRMSLEGKTKYEKRKVNVKLPTSGNYCELEKDFSGRLTLESKLFSDEDCEAYIQFESIDFFAALYVNGKYCGSAAFAPYLYKVKLKKGANKLVLKVSGTAGNEFRRCFREELEPAGYFNGYAKRFTLYPVDDAACGVSNNIKIYKERM